MHTTRLFHKKFIEEPTLSSDDHCLAFLFSGGILFCFVRSKNNCPGLALDGMVVHDFLRSFFLRSAMGSATEWSVRQPHANNLCRTVVFSFETSIKFLFKFSFISCGACGKNSLRCLQPSWFFSTWPCSGLGHTGMRHGVHCSLENNRCSAQTSFFSAKRPLGSWPSHHEAE